MEKTHNQIERRLGPDYSIKDIIVNAPELYVKYAALFAGLISITAPEAGIYALADGVKQILDQGKEKDM